VPILSDGRWEENFSPNLLVTRIRVFVERGYNPDTGGPHRHYLAPDRVILNQLEVCLAERDPDTGAGELDPAGCGLAVTPTYRLADLRRPGPIDDGDRLEWPIEFRSYTDGSRPPEALPAQGEPLYIEFAVVDRTVGVSGTALLVAPQSQIWDRSAAIPHGCSSGSSP
jgi:hypothetical protein